MTTAAQPLKFRQLQYFLAVAELRHFTRAAEQLNVTQPTLSHQIADLEQQLGTPLFDRVGKTVQLTEAGALFRNYAHASLRQLESGRSALTELRGLERGVLRIGASQSFVRGPLTLLLAEFAREYPGIALEILELNALNIETGLTKGDLDIGLAYAPAILPEIAVEPLFDESLLLVVRRSHPLAQKKQIKLSELNGIPLALFGADYQVRKVIDSLLIEAGATPRMVAVSNSVSVLLGMAEAGDTATIVLESALSHQDDFAAIRLTDPSPKRTSAIMWSKQNFRSAASLRFAAMLRDRLSTRRKSRDV